MSIHGKGYYAGAGIAAVALIIAGVEIQQQDADPGLKYVQVSKHSAALEREEIVFRKKGEEIKSKRTPTMEVFKADSAGTRFTAHIYAVPKYFYDTDGDSLQALDLSERDIDALAKDDALKSEKKHDRYIKAGPYKMTWFTGARHDYKIYSEDGRETVKFTALHSLANMTVSTTPIAGGVKQTWMLSSGAATELRWLVDSTFPLIYETGGSALTGVFRITAPKAWDADSTVVPVMVEIRGDTLVYRVDTDGMSYPVTVDPSTTVTALTAQSGTLYGDNATYLTQRNGATAYDIQAALVEAGQKAGNFESYRSFMAFTGFPAMISVSACTLYCEGYSNASTTDFNVNLFGANSYKSALTTADFSKFDGWVSSGAYTGTVLNETWGTASYSTGWNAIVFAAAGLDSINAAKADTLWIAMLSSRDVAATEPGGDEYVAFDLTAGGNAPYLSFTYTVPSIAIPTNFHMTPITGYSDSMALSWTTNSVPDSIVLYRWPDSLRVATLDETASTARIGGLNPYTRYRYYIRADSAGIYGYSARDSLWTNQTFKTENFSLLNAGYAQNAATAVYDSARGETNADSLSSGATLLGQWWADATHKYVLRHFQDVALPKLVRVEAESLFISGIADSSYTDFTINARAGTWVGGTTAKLKYNMFDGWQSQMTPYTGSALITPFSTAGFTTGATLNKLVFTAAGKDTTVLHGLAPDTLRIMLLSSRDISATAPTVAEYITMTEASSYLRLTYAPPDSIPSGFTLTAVSSDSVVAAWTDRSYSERGFVVYDFNTGSKVAGTDTTGAGVTSLRIGGLTPNTKYRYQVKAIGGSVATTLTAPDSAYTYAATPSAPTRSNPASDSTKVIINANGNPSYTRFAIAAVDTTGDTTHVDFGAWPRRLLTGSPKLDSTRHWAIRDSMGGNNGVTVATGIGKWYKWIVKAKNGL
jgi:hypothetical protein